MAATMPARSLPADLGFEPDPDLAQPIYAQLAAALSQAIRSGRIALGTRLPAERAAAAQLGVSRTTVTAAYQELAAAGLVRGHVGRGTVVVGDDTEGRGGTVAWRHLGSRLSRPAPASVAVDPGVVSLGNGWLHASLMPGAALAAAAARASQRTALTESAPMLGLPALRSALADGLRGQGVKAAPGEVLITGGAQQGLNVVARALLSPGDTVLCESPSWHGAFRAFRAAGAEVVGVPMDAEGIDADALESALVRLRPKLVYLIPNFHCPTGRLMSLPRRRRVLELCARLRTPVVESQVYGDTAFDKPLPSLKSLDSAGVVILQGSASKSISAGLRLGWLVAPPPAIELLAPAKASLDLATPAWSQAVLAEFIASGAYARHLPGLRAQLRQRRDALADALARHCPGLRFALPQGGLYLWVQLPRPLQAAQVEAAAAAEGVVVRGGDAFQPEGGGSSHLRLCFAAPASAEIEAGVQRLGHALRALAQRPWPAESEALAAPV